jgi:hypothetical protein
MSFNFIRLPQVKLPAILQQAVSHVEERLNGFLERLRDFLRDMERRGRTVEFRREHDGASPESEALDQMPKEDRIVEVVARLGGGLTLGEIAEALDKTHQSLARAAGNLVSGGRLERREGKYFLPED